MIIGEIRRYLRDNNIVRVSRSIRDIAYKTMQVKEKLTKETGKEPGIEEIAKELEVTPEEIAFSLDAIQDPVSLQEPVYNASHTEQVVHQYRNKCRMQAKQYDKLPECSEEKTAKNRAEIKDSADYSRKSV